MEQTHYHIMPDFDQLPDPTRLERLKDLAENSPLTTPQVAAHMLPSIVQLLKKFMSEEKTLHKLDSLYVECLLYMLHHMAHKVPSATNKLCGYKFETDHPSDIIEEEDRSELYKKFVVSLNYLKDLTETSIEYLVQDMRDLDKANKHPESLTADVEADLHKERQETKNELRTCINILAMTENLQGEAPSFMGYNSIKLSWKEANFPTSCTNLYMYPNFDLWVDIPDMEALDLVLEDPSFPKENYDKLINEGCCQLEDHHVVALVGTLGLQQVKDTSREDKCFLQDNTEVAFLYWKINQSKFLRFLTAADSMSRKRLILGYIRNQLYHLLCWAYVACDLVSAARIIGNWEKEYTPLCPWYLCAFCHPEFLGTDKTAMEGHHCYGSLIHDALLHIKEFGIPREVCQKFDCKDYRPPTADEPEIDKRKIKSVERIDTLEEALRLSPDIPIGANLIVFPELWTIGDGIYYGPGPNTSGFDSYHAVIIMGIEIYKGEVVVVCKMSNGTKVGDEGYIRVSLAVMYLIVGVLPDQDKYVSVTSKPMHLLSNFIILEVDKKETEQREEKAEEKPEQKSDFDKVAKRRKTASK